MTNKEILDYIEGCLKNNDKGTMPYIIANLAKRQLIKEQPDLAPTEDEAAAEEETGLADIAGDTAGDTTGKKPEETAPSGNALNGGSNTTTADADTTDVSLDFGVAIRALQGGFKVARKGWNGKGMWLELQAPDKNSKMTLPYIYLNYPNDSEHTPGARVPWLASQTDALATDWVILK